jgi:hypothetical protein
MVLKQIHIGSDAAGVHPTAAKVKAVVAMGAVYIIFVGVPFPCRVQSQTVEMGLGGVAPEKFKGHTLLFAAAFDRIIRGKTGEKTR